jgi:hypothetical protein
MTSIIINCAGDNELARKIYGYLIDRIISSKDTTYISLSEDQIEIVLEKLGVSRDYIREQLHEFIRTDPELADFYSITEFDDVFVVGILKRLDENSWTDFHLITIILVLIACQLEWLFYF